MNEITTMPEKNEPSGHVTHTELLRHYNCASCGRWWSIGDGPEFPVADSLYCPWCGFRPIEYREEVDWLPIETAPKGKKILLLWTQEGPFNGHVEDGELDEDGHRLFDGDCLSKAPTHWRPYLIFQGHAKSTIKGQKNE